MNRLLAIEWMKIKRYRTFWVLSGLFALFLILWNYGISQNTLKFGGGSGNSQAQVDVLNSSYNFSFLWQNLGFWSSVFVVFISVLVIIVTTNEYVYRTNRQNIIDGYTRIQYYHAKWLLVVALAIATTLFVFLVGLGLGLSNDSFSNFPGEIKHLFYLLLLSINYYGFALMLALLFKRSGITIGIFFMYYLIIENLAENLLNRGGSTIGNYLPLQASDELLPLPLMDILKVVMQTGNTPTVSGYIIASVAWIIVYYIIGRLRLVKSDW